MFFLRRKRTVTRAFWIDAICINQDDKAEKSEQIGRMVKIYKNASSVVAELGPASEDEQAVLEKMEYLTMFILTKKHRIGPEESRPRATIENIQLPPEFVKLYDAQMWEGLGSFFGRPWWIRAWIMQEATAISSKDTRLLCGEVEVLLVHALSYNLAVRILSRIWGSMPTKTSIPWHVVNRINKFQDKREREVMMPLLDVLEAFRGLSATDPRDIIYAALNIATDLREGDIQADYSVSVANAYRAVAIHYLKNAVEPLRILSYCGTRSQTLDFEVGWASWVPSWYKNYPRSILRNSVTAEDGSQRPAYNPCGNAHSSAELYPIRTEDNVLTIHGFLIDRLSSLSDPCFAGTRGEGLQIVDSWVPKAPTALYRTGETIIDAFLKTVVANMSDPRVNPQRGSKANWDLVKDSFTVGNFGTELEHVIHYVQGRRLGYSMNGYMALVSHQAKEGDLLYALFGGSVLYVLRPEGDRFIIVGECYVHRLIDGEAMQLLETRQAVTEVVSII